MMALSDEDIKRLDDRYVMQNDCDTRHKAVDARQAQTELTVAVHGTQLGSLIKVLATVGSAIAVAIIGIAIKVIFGG